jgi:plastocyanin
MKTKIIIFVLLIALAGIFYLNLRRFHSQPEISKDLNLQKIYIQFDRNIWKIENNIPITKIKKDGKINKFEFKLRSLNAHREVRLVENFPEGIKYKLNPEKLTISPGQTIDFSLEISADKNVKEKEITVKFDGVDINNTYKIILEDVKKQEETEKETNLERGFKVYKDPSGLKIYYPKDFIILNKESLKSLIPQEAETDVLFTAGNFDGSLQIMVTKTNVPPILTLDQILEFYKNVNEFEGASIKVLNIEKGENPIIEEEASYENTKFIIKNKFILKKEETKSILYLIVVISKEEKYKENLKTINEIINKSGF